jgi:hypothetical protein
MPSLDLDKRFYESGISLLADYLLSKELFYPLDGNLPRLTIGNLLLVQLRLQSSGMNEKTDQVELIRTKWHVAWEQKISREVHARFELWQNFISEYQASHENNADRYPVEVRHRTIIHILSKESDKASEMNLLSQLDDMLRRNLLPGGFIWEKQVESGFPQPEYWFLYGRLKNK